MNSNGDRVSLCLSPLEDLKKPLGDPFTNTENLAVEMHILIYCIHFFMGHRQAAAPHWATNGRLVKVKKRRAMAIFTHLVVGLVSVVFLAMSLLGLQSPSEQ